MMVHRTGGTRGNAEIDIRIEGFGRFRVSAQTTRSGAVARRKALARLLGELGQYEVLLAIKKGELAWGHLEHAQRQQRLASASLLADLRLKGNLATAIAATLPAMGPTALTRDRYRVALDALWHLGFDRESSTVADLKRDDWRELLAAWEASPATKNGVRTAVSRFLTRFLGDKHHPFRRAVLHEDRWPRLKVPKRVKGFDVAEFWPLMRLMPERLVPSFVVLAASGMRVGEYLNDDALEVDETHHVIHVKGKTGFKSYGVDPVAWEYVRAGVPCRASRMTKTPTRLQNDPRYKALYRAMRAAGEQLGIRISPHDLRRLYARLGVEARGQTATQHAIGHETPGMTADYARWHSQADVSSAVAKALGLGKPKKRRRAAR